MRGLKLGMDWTPESSASEWGSLGEPQMLYDARYGLTYDGSNNVSSWVPKLGSGTLTATGSARPLYVADRGDGKPELRFNGTTHVLKNLALTAPNATDWTVGFVGRFPTAGRAILLGVRAGSYGANRHMDIYWASSKFYATRTANSSTATLPSNGTVSAVNRGAFSARCTANVLSSRHAGGYAQTAASNTHNAAPDSLNIGAYETSSFGNVYISALAVYPFAVPLADLNALLLSHFPEIIIA